MTLLNFTNRGISLVDTNYFESDWSARGALFLSWNAGAARLLVPDRQLHTLVDMAPAKLVVVSRGLFRGEDCYELMFDDGNGNPFTWFFSIEQTDRPIPAVTESFLLIVHSNDGAEMVFNARYRLVMKLPCYQPWKGSRGAGGTRLDPWGFAYAATRALPAVAAADDARLVRLLLKAGADPTALTPNGIARCVAAGVSAKIVEQHIGQRLSAELDQAISLARPAPQRARL